MSPHLRALLLCALSVPISAPSAATYAHTLSGDQFVHRMNRPEPLSSYDYMQREKAYSYLDGARDAVEGRVWCDVEQLKTPDMAYELADDISKMPPAERKKNASLLLLDLLQRKHPCRQAGGKQ